MNRIRFCIGIYYGIEFNSDDYEHVFAEKGKMVYLSRPIFKR